MLAKDTVCLPSWFLAVTKDARGEREGNPQRTVFQHLPFFSQLSWSASEIYVQGESSQNRKGECFGRSESDAALNSFALIELDYFGKRHFSFLLPLSEDGWHLKKVAFPPHPHMWQKEYVYLNWLVLLSKKAKGRENRK